MPDTADPAPSSVPPKVVISRPAEDFTRIERRPTLATRRKTEPPPSLLYKEQERIAADYLDWEDEDESPKRKRSRRRSSRDSEYQDSKSGNSNRSTPRKIERDLGRFFPSLTRIAEVNESLLSSRTSTTSSENRRRRHRSSAKPMRREEPTSSYRRPVRHRRVAESRSVEGALKLNPSLLSVLSTLTSSSSLSSGSGSTITQRSYDRESAYRTRTMSRRASRDGYEDEVDARTSLENDRKATNVFDYMDAPAVEDCAERRSTISSSSSHYQPSDAGSSDAPGTPSSRSTFPSPTTSKGQSSPELQRHYATSTGSMRSDSKSPDPSIRSLRKQPSVCDSIEEEDEDPPGLASESASIPQRRSSSRSSRSSRCGSDRLQLQEESVHQHMAYSQGHYIEPIYGQHRSSSASSAHSDRSGHSYHMAMQQYPWPLPPAPTAPAPALPQAMNGHLSPTERTAAPDALDLAQRNLTGYEMLATELANRESSFKPLYRKFEYLHHRVLLHVQDELSELEEQLRAIDLAIAQMDPGSCDGQKTPPSRRGEAFHGNEIHHRRTYLLGRIFQKTEQYNKAMCAYAAMANESAPADREQVDRYKEWMSKHAPIHEIETRFLQREDDLVSPGKGPSPTKTEGASKHAALAYLPIALMLPLLLYSVIPSLAGRLVVTALVAVGVFVVATTTEVRQLMAARDWAVSGGAYVLLMAAIAGCIPSHA